MNSSLRSVVTGVGDYLPARIVTNDDLAKIVETSDDWIRERTGIRQRREAVEGEMFLLELRQPHEALQRRRSHLEDVLEPKVVTHQCLDLLDLVG